MARRLALATALVLPFVIPPCTTALVNIDVSDQASIVQAAASIANGLMTTYYNENSTAGDFDQPQPWYWWLSGSAWTGLLDYTVYTGDTTYKAAILAALSKNLGPNLDFAPPEQAHWEANDDQAYWLFGALTALEYGFDEPPQGDGTWLAAANNVFNAFISRWTADSVTCGGGLRWQFDPSAKGYFYKNSVTNGAFFQIAARLARYSGITTYAEWATTVWDWATGVGLLAQNFSVYDGAYDKGNENCASVNHDLWTYNVATYLHGAANMYAYTGALGLTDQQAVWAARVQGLMNTAFELFFSPPDGHAPNVMYEWQCELTTTCTADQTSFKGSLARWLGKTAVLVPEEMSQILVMLRATASSAAPSCTDDSGDVQCPMKWWTAGVSPGGSDLGSMLSTLEVVQSLLVTNAPVLATLAPA